MQDVLELCQGMEAVSFAAGEKLMQEGGKSGVLYIQVSSGVEVIKGETPITRICEPRAVFGGGVASARESPVSTSQQISVIGASVHPIKLGQRMVEVRGCQDAHGRIMADRGGGDKRVRRARSAEGEL